MCVWEHGDYVQWENDTIEWYNRMVKMIEISNDLTI